MQTTKKGDAFLIYVLTTLDAKSPCHEISSQYKEFKDVFEKKNVDTLLKHRPYDYTIDLEEGTWPPFELIYNLVSQDEHATFCEYIDKNLEKGFIWHSKSPIDALILFVKKKNGSLWMCVNYRGLSQLIIKNWYPLLLILGLLKQLSHAKVYTKIDLCGTYNLMHIRQGDEQKVAFRTWYGHFQYIVMPFGITNALAIFQHLMNNAFCEYWMILWYVTSMTSSFSQRTWKTMNSMYIQC